MVCFPMLDAIRGRRERASWPWIPIATRMIMCWGRSAMSPSQRIK